MVYAAAFFIAFFMAFFIAAFMAAFFIAFMAFGMTAAGGRLGTGSGSDCAAISLAATWERRRVCHGMWACCC